MKIRFKVELEIKGNKELEALAKGLGKDLEKALEKFIEKFEEKKKGNSEKERGYY